MSNEHIYDVSITGGGLAGLALSIQLAQARYKIILLEKEQYPFHRVCGEYISMESWDFLRSLGLDLPAMKPSMITRLQLSSVSGKSLQQQLPLGGFGISRYVLDHALMKIARSSGVEIKEQTKVQDIVAGEKSATIITDNGQYQTKIAAGSFGKRSNIDIKWKRDFAVAAKNRLNNYIGVKYHIRSGFPNDTIALHCFPGGYCGLVKIEDDQYNLCYLTTADNLKRSGNDIVKMEQTILSRNPHLQKIFSSLSNDRVPVTISQISFDKKKQVEDHVLMIGDSAGMIAPLCGNGMSMALHGSKIAFACIDKHLKGETDRDEMEKEYIRNWQQQFAARLRMGRRIQKLSGHSFWVNLLINSGKIFPALIRKMIRQTHGKPF
jgi:flavin-dependent dehydrogenase